jgi:twitching motility two-component system response regulator PilH
MEGQIMELGETVLIADPDEHARAELTTLLAGDGYAVVETDRGDDALAVARSLNPAAVITEIPLEGLCGYELCRTLKSDPAFDVPVIIVSRVRTEPYDRIAGLLLKADDYIVSPYLPGELLARLANLIGRARSRVAGTQWQLTGRESEILGLMGDGLRHVDIAQRLFISPKTVATHVEHILRKLSVRSSRQAVAVAYREGLIVASEASEASAAGPLRG